MADNGVSRRRPVGAEVVAGGVHFRVWAPRWRRVEVVVEGDADGPDPARLEPEGDGYFSALVPGAGPGDRYRFRVGRSLYPDPASRYQPEGPTGPSEVVDPSAFAWGDSSWPGVRLKGQVIYELHVGTFTREGTWEAAARWLPALADVGITTVELMPVADFPGRFGWGYDGVSLFAPCRLYGTPDDFRRFVDAAHGLGLGVILDVVYNHFGPEGNVLKEFSDRYESDRHETEWGKAINFDGPDSGPVREFFAANAAYWVDEFHLDGLRIDATQEFYDASIENIITLVARSAREAARGRSTIIIGENEPQHARHMRPIERGGFGLDALWADDFHHVAVAALLGRKEAYYGDYRATPQEFVSALKHGFLYQGQWNARQGKRRGSPALGLPREQFIIYLQNHDQVANSLRGDRLQRLGGPAMARALTAVLLLAPETPMLFQGQEFAASSPFFYFGDHEPDLAAKMRSQRKEFLAQFPSLRLPEARALLADPADPETFERSKIDQDERERHVEVYRLHQDLLGLRRRDPVLREQGAGGLDGAVLGPSAFVIRHFGRDEGDDRLVLVNLGADAELAPVSEPLLAPPEGMQWDVLWSSEDVRYGGRGTPPVVGRDGWHLIAHSAVVLGPGRDRLGLGGDDDG